MSKRNAERPALPPLPESIRQKLPAGVTLFSRPEQGRWIMSLAPAWKQIRLPKEIVRPDAAYAFVLAYLDERKLNPGAGMDRNRDEGPNLRYCADRWLAKLEADDRCAPATFKGHRSHLKLWILPKFGATPVAALDVPMARAWMIELRLAKKNGRTVSHMWSTFTSLYDYCMAEGYVKSIADDPWSRGRVNVLRHPAVLAEAPEIEETEPHTIPLRILRPLIASPSVGLHNRARYVLGVTGGFRDGEIAGIQLKSLDLDGNDEEPPAVRIEQSLATVGAKVGVAYAKPKKPKTQSSKRKAPLHPAAVAALREWLTEGWPAYVGRRPGPEDYLFPRPDGKPCRPKSARELREDLIRSGLPTEHEGRPFEFKDLRATFATALQEAGVDERIIKRLMGHRTVGVTERHYTKRDLRTMGAAVAMIDLTWESSLPAFPLMTHEATKSTRSTRPNSADVELAHLAAQERGSGTEICTVQPTVQVRTVIARIPLDSRSHLRGLNSRPTVYERAASSRITVDGWEKIRTKWLQIPRRAAVRRKAAVARRRPLLWRRHPLWRSWSPGCSPMYERSEAGRQKSGLPSPSSGSRNDAEQMGLSG